MKFLKTFENFYLPQDMETDEQDYLTHRKISNSPMDDDDDEYCDPCENDDEMPEFEGPEDFEEESRNSHIMRFEESKKSKPDFLDIDKDGDKKESMKKAAKDAKEKKDVKSNKGLSAAQKKLPPALQKAILSKKK
jgi:hypothetical protein